jgi:hypothetical protein
MTTKPYRPQDMPEYRNAMVASIELWEAVDSLSRHVAMTSHGRDFEHPELIRESMAEATLWWIGADACDLLAAAAPSMPPTTLTPMLMRDPVGLVCFERAIAGLDADDPERPPVMVDLYQWDRRTVEGQDAVSIITWHYMADTGVTVPLGRADWVMGTDTDHRIVSDRTTVSDDAHASIVEDRRILAAMWQLSSQPNITDTTDAEPDRATQRRLSRRGHAVPPVRIVNLAARHGAHRTESEESEGGRTYTRRWIVEGHWRQQACGPQWSQRRPTYIPAHVKGPTDAPLVTREAVKVWR